MIRETTRQNAGGDAGMMQGENTTRHETPEAKLANCVIALLFLVGPIILFLYAAGFIFQERSA